MARYFKANKHDDSLECECYSFHDNHTMSTILSGILQLNVRDCNP